MAKSLIVSLVLCGQARAETAVAVEPPLDHVPEAWRFEGRSSADERIELTFAVKQRGLEELHNALMRVSSPSSPDYGMHLSNDQVNAMTAPDPMHLQAVKSFLQQYGITPRAGTPNSDIIEATVPVELAERMLSTEYSKFVHSNTGVQVSRALGGYSLPADVAAAVDFVAPTVHMPGVHRPQQESFSSSEKGPLSVNTPKNLRKLYNIEVEGMAEGSKHAVTAFLEQGFSAKALNNFQKKYCGGIVCGKGDVKKVGDAVDPSPKGAGIEAMLDIETITGVAGNIESEFWAFAGHSPDNTRNEPFMKWLSQMSSTADEDVPKIFSTSYGEGESSWSYPAAQRLNVEFQKAGARGISLLYASGDSGANCKTINGTDTLIPGGPASSPWVTAVGGTKPSGSYPTPGNEAAIGLSGGGFSNYWPMPDYQKAAVAAYLQQKGLPPASQGYNTSGRAYPDISAQATNFIVYADGVPVPAVQGTSCATPTAAGVFSLLNDLRLQRGQPSLGFLNPLIYEHALAFNDITEGSSNGCGLFFSGGWPATAGWDAATGMGTPDYKKLAEVIATLPAGSLAGIEV